MIHDIQRRPVEVSQQLVPGASLLAQIGLSPEQANTVLATPEHGQALEALFAGANAPMKMIITVPVRFPGPPGARADASSGREVRYEWRSHSALPQNVEGLFQALAKTAPSQTVALLAVALTCHASVQTKAAIATACVQAHLAAPELKLTHEQNAAVQYSLCNLLEQNDIAADVKQKWAPLLVYDSQHAAARLEQLSQTDNSSSATSPAQKLAGLFHAALMKGDQPMVDRVLNALSELQDAQAQQLYTQCSLLRVQPEDPPIPVQTGSEPAPLASSVLAVQELNRDGPHAMADAVVNGDVAAIQKLIGGSGAFLLNTALPPGGWTALTLAASLGKTDVVRLLLTCDGVLINARCPGSQDSQKLADSQGHAGTANGATALFMAAKNGHDEIARLLVQDKRTDIHATNSRGSSPYSIAAGNGHLNLVKFLLALPGTDINQVNVDKATPLYMAAQNGHLGVVEFLLKQPDVEINKRRRAGYTPLIIAASEGNVEVVKCLLRDKRIDVGAGTDQNNTALHGAASGGHAAVVKVLLDDGRADPAAANQWGMTPLHMAAAQKDKPEIVELFLEKYPKRIVELANLADKWGATPIAVAAECGADLERVIEQLQGCTRMAPPAMRLAKNIVTNYLTGWLLVGSDHPAYLSEGARQAAASGGVTLNYFGDGLKSLTWDDYRNLKVASGTFFVFNCHGSWDNDFHKHVLKFGEKEFVPTIEAMRVACDKGVRKMTIYACQIEKAAERMAQRINLDPGWPKPVDPELEITFVGGEENGLMVTAAHDLANRISDFGSLARGGNGGSMERLTVSSICRLIWDANEGKVVVKRRGPPKASERGQLTQEERRILEGHLLLKRAYRGRTDKLSTLLAESGVDVNFIAKAGTTALYVAAEAGHLETVELLLTQKRININCENSIGQTALYVAAARGHTEVVKLLLKQEKIKINNEDFDGRTALYVAASNGHIEVVKLLLTRKAKLYSSKGLPAYIAHKKGHTEISELLNDAMKRVSHPGDSSESDICVTM